MNLTYSKKDFEGLRFPIGDIQAQGSVLKNCQEMDRYPEFKMTVGKTPLPPKDYEGPELPRYTIAQSDILRYVAFVYDKNSPYQAEKNLNKRKVQVMEEIGWLRDDDGKWLDGRLQDIIERKNKTVNRMIVRYVRLIDDMAYQRLVAGLELYSDHASNISESSSGDPIADSKVKSVLYNEMGSLQISIENLANEVFSGDHRLLHTVDEVAEEEKGVITSYPEHIANLRDEGKF